MDGLLTIVVTTSPVDSHPNTSILEQTITSLSLIPCLCPNPAQSVARTCRLVIVCDGCRVTDDNKFRQGKVTSDKAADYDEYKRRLRELSAQDQGWLAGAEIVELKERMGFSFALKAGIEHVNTPYVMVVQHDRVFKQGFPLHQLLLIMSNHRDTLKFVSLPSSSTVNYAQKTLSRYTIFLDPLTLHLPFCELAAPCECAGIPSATQALHFVPLLQFYDSTHVCLTQHYREFIFNRRYGFAKRGDFIESRMGPIMLADIRENGMEQHAKYATWVLEVTPGDAEANHLVQHLDAHSGAHKCPPRTTPVSVEEGGLAQNDEQAQDEE
eukprot:c2576_g1_i1.p1 GENE.c2576_g1_i1~~c2576_g1_i1.p1  ORF type:complete len:333 (+),score=67.10 c2576_g1_i1:27-1001(+)